MPDELRKRGIALEQAFSNSRNQELLGELREREVAKVKKTVLSGETGIQDATVLDALVAVGIDGATLAALSLAPLVLMAWRDGRIQTHERAAILRAAEDRGFPQGSSGFVLVESWLDARPGPQLRPAWEAYLQSLRAHLSPEDYSALRKDIVSRTREVARAAGGILGLLAVSRSEKALLAEIEAAFA